MSDGDWDAEDYDAPVAAPTASKSLYADEDAEDDVKESWEDSDDDEAAAQKAAQANKPAPPVRQKGITRAKIAEKEAAEAARAQELAALAEEDPRERRKREMQIQMAQDLENARALLGDAGISEKAVVGAGAVEGSNPFAAFPNPRTKPEMESFATALAKYIVDNYSSKPLYHDFVNTLVREACLPLKDLDVRKCASTLTAVANEKQKAAREGATKKGKGKGKPQLGVVGSGGNKAAMSGRGFTADLDAHTAALDDDYDDDFM